MVKGKLKKRKRGRTYEILHRRVARLVDAFHELEDVMREAIDHRYPNIMVVFILRINTSPINIRTQSKRQPEG